MTTGQPVVRLTGLATLIIAALCALTPAAAMADRAFSTRFATNDTGDIVSIANTLMTCPAGSSSSVTPKVACADAQQIAPSTTANTAYNNNYDMTYVDTDATASTFDSSSANLSIPSGATVLFAGLYWAGDASAGTTSAPDATARGTALFRAPGASAYTSLTASQIDTSDANTGRYQAYRDVTSLVQAAGSGTYTVANVQAAKGSDKYAGWSLVIAYRDTTQPARNLTVFDGLKSVSSTGTVSIPVSGFLTPPSGAVNTELGFIAYEGDNGIVGDTAALNGHTLADAQHPATNFFNSRISRDGVLVSGKSPDYANQLGFDNVFTNADGILGNSATSATITVSTTGDVYIPGVITFATEIYAPKIDQAKTVSDDNGGDVEEGDTLTYTVSGTNSGKDGTSGFILRDPIPANVEYVPGSIKLTDAVATSATAATDAADADRAEYDTTNNRILARLGAGSSGTVGGNIAPGKSYAVTFKVKVHGPASGAGAADKPVPPGTTILNTATASFVSQTTATPLSAVSSASTTVKAPDLAITKTRTGSALVVGGTSQYTLHVSNVGTAKTQGTITVSDPLPTNLSVTSFAAPGWACAGTTSVTCTRSDALAAGGAYPDIVVNVSVGAGTPANVSNTATVSGGGDGNLTNNSSTDTSPATQVADLGIVKTAPATVNVGDAFDYTLVVTNNGPSPATSVAVSDPLPGRVSYLSDDSGCTIAPASGVVACALGTLTSGASRTIKVHVRAESDGAGTTVANTASVGAQQTDPNPANNTSTAAVFVTGVDLAVTKRLLSPASPKTGDTVTYSLSVTNNGPSRATNVVLNDVLGDGLTGLATDGSLSGCATTATTLSCTIPALAVGGKAQVLVTAKVKPNQTQIVNHASATAAEGDGDLTNNSADVTTPVTATADLALVKSADHAQTSPGGTLAYTFTVTNGGPDTASGITVKDTLPAALTYVSGASGCGAAGQVVTCAIASLPAGSSAQAVITVKVSDAATGTISNTGTVAATTADPDPSDNVSTVLTPVLSNADVSITKTAAPLNPAPGDTITYTLTARNDGPADAKSVLVGDTLPAGVSYTGVDSTDCTQAAGSVSCAFGTLAAGATRTVHVTATANAAGGVPDPGAQHQLTDGKVEKEVDLDPGQTTTATIDCGDVGPGYILTDGSVRLVAVDQGTGTFADAHVLSARSSGVSTFTATVRNGATGRVQTKLFGNCVSPTTSDDGGHHHSILISAPVTTSQSVLAGDNTATLQCGPGKTPVAPGYDFGTSFATIQASEPTADGTGWTFRYAVAEAATPTFSIRCVDDYLSVLNGHTHQLNLHRITRTVSVPANGTTTFQLICGDDEKGIVGDWDLAPGLLSLGNEPQPKTRVFAFFNPTNGPLDATIGLLCLGNHTGPEVSVSTVTNDATVSTSTQESSTANNAASATVTINDGGIALAPRPTVAPALAPVPAPASSPAPVATPSVPAARTSTVAARSGKVTLASAPATVTGSTAAILVTCLKGGPTCAGTVTLRSSSKGKALAAGGYAITAGRKATVKVRASALRTLTKAVVTLAGKDGRKVVRTLKLRHKA